MGMQSNPLFNSSPVRPQGRWEGVTTCDIFSRTSTYTVAAGSGVTTHYRVLHVMECQQ